MTDVVICETVAQYLEHGYTIFGWCQSCDRIEEVDMSKLAKRQPDVKLARVRFWCRGCGKSGKLTVRPPDAGRSHHSPVFLAGGILLARALTQMRVG